MCHLQILLKRNISAADIIDVTLSRNIYSHLSTFIHIDLLFLVTTRDTSIDRMFPGASGHSGRPETALRVSFYHGASFSCLCHHQWQVCLTCSTTRRAGNQTLMAATGTPATSIIASSLPNIWPSSGSALNCA